jgi:alpha-D-ribose 1-methylphosphonate 5-triphosphate synthase subunit PhnH
MHKETKYDEVFDAQRHYRQLLDCMARPGKINVLPRPEWAPPAGLHTAGALVGFALLNPDVSFCVLGAGADTLTQYIQINTAAKTDAVALADYIFMDGDAPMPVAKRGTLPYPEESATLVVAVDRLSAEGGDVAVSLTGPGVEGRRTFWIDGLDIAFLSQLRECNAEFPLGIDVVLTDAEQRIACIPRSSQIHIN